jgi:hypothetical protein
MPSSQVAMVVFKGQQFGIRIKQLYSPDMIRAFYVHYRGLADAELAVGEPVLAAYYEAIADTIYEDIRTDPVAKALVDGGG